MKKFKIKVNFISFIILAGFIAIGIRLFQVQIVQHRPYTTDVKNKVDRIVKIQLPRGSILDCKNQPLATSMAIQLCYIEPGKAEKYINKYALAKCTKLPVDYINSKFNYRNKHVLLKENILQEEIDKIKTTALMDPKKNSSESGIFFEKGQSRSYPQNALANYVVGTVGSENKGQSGIELLFDSFLTGKLITYTTTIDRKGRAITAPNIPEEKKSVILTIDSKIQHAVEKEIEKAYLDTKPNLVTCIVQNPQTGEILAMATYPSFDSNIKHKRDQKMFKNPAIANTYEPGSVYKIVAAAAALENNPEVYNDKFYCELGKYRLSKDVTIHDAIHQYGLLSFEEIFAYSSNIGFSKLSKKIGSHKLWQYSRLFSFGEKTGIDLPAEEKGTLKPPEKWSGITCQMMSFGQEVSVTPLQIVNAYSAIANGGFLMEPLIVKSMVCNGKEQKVYEPCVIRRVMSQHTVSKMTEMLEAVVNYGTGDRAKIPGIQIAGKTGTAQKYDRKQRHYSEKKYVSSFAGFFPADNPKATVLVMIDEPTGDYWASSVAAPVFKRIASDIIEYLNIQPVTKVASK